MGVSAGITLILSMVKVKFAAVSIGAGGVGLSASFMAIQNIIGTLAGLGISSSAVREIAVPLSLGDQITIARKIFIIRRISWIAGFVGMISLVLLSRNVSEFTFGHHEYTLDISMLGLTILFLNITGGEVALIQGTRKIDILAKANVISAIIATILSIVFLAAFGVHGIAPSLVLASITQFIVTWNYSRHIKFEKVTITTREALFEAKGMLPLGLVMMFNSLLISIVNYIAIVLITNQEGIIAVGIYSAAFALSGMLINFVLNSIAVDYYPRLTGLISDKKAMNLLVNEQAQIAILLALPGLIITMALGPWLIDIFYSNEFYRAVKLIHWFTLGCMAKVVSWSLGFVMLAMGKSKLFLITETSFNLLHIILIFFGLRYFELEGVAMAFFIIYLGYSATMYYVCKRLMNFTWSFSTLRILHVATITLSLSFIALRFLDNLTGFWMVISLALVTGAYCLRYLIRNLGANNRLLIFLNKVPFVKSFLS
jgi:antigen flippase